MFNYVDTMFALNTNRYTYLIAYRGTEALPLFLTEYPQVGQFLLDLLGFD